MYTFTEQGSYIRAAEVPKLCSSEHEGVRRKKEVSLLVGIIAMLWATKAKYKNG